MPKVSLVKRDPVDLGKDAGRALRELNLGGIELDVELVLDRSGSMQDEYRSGLVQLVLDRVYAAVQKVDRDGVLPVTLFHFKTMTAPPLNAQNLDGYVRSQLGQFDWGGTRYAPPLELLAKRHALSGVFSKTPADKAKMVIFVTDGVNDDPASTHAAMRLLSKKAPVFVVFVGLDTDGRADFSTLERLDDMAGRDFDNAGYFRWDGNVTDQQFYQNLFKELPKALSDMKRLGLLK